MQIPPGAATVWLAAFSSTLGKCAAHQPVAGGQLSDARAKSPFVGRELQAGNRGVRWPIHLIYIHNTRLRVLSNLKIQYENAPILGSAEKYFRISGLGRTQMSSCGIAGYPVIPGTRPSIFTTFTPWWMSWTEIRAIAPFSARMA